MIDAARKYLLDLILENEEVKKFPKDFVTASMQWIRSWFLIDDPTAEILLDLTGAEAAKTKLVEAKLPQLLENQAFVQELERKMAEFAVQRERISNVVDHSNIEVGGNVRIGNRGVPPTGAQYDQENVVRNSTIKAGGNFTLGNDNVQASGNVHIGDVHFHGTSAPQRKPEGQNATSPLVKTMRDLIASGRTDEVFPKLLDYTEEFTPHLISDSIQLSGRWESLKRQERVGVLSHSEANLERNKVNNALLDLMKNLA